MQILKQFIVGLLILVLFVMISSGIGMMVLYFCGVQYKYTASTISVYFLMGIVSIIAAWAFVMMCIALGELLAGNKK